MNIINDATIPQVAYTLPNGVKILELFVESDISDMPKAVEYEGEIYGRSGWNSDRMVAFYRTDIKIAKIIKG